MIASVVLLSPYSRHVWNADDQEYMKAASDTINDVLKKRLPRSVTSAKLRTSTRSFLFPIPISSGWFEEKESLKEQIAELQEKLATNQTQETGGLELAGTKICIGKNISRRLRKKMTPSIPVSKKLIEKAKTLTEEHGKLLEENEVLQEPVADLTGCPGPDRCHGECQQRSG